VPASDPTDEKCHIVAATELDRVLAISGVDHVIAIGACDEVRRRRRQESGACHDRSRDVTLAPMKLAIDLTLHRLAHALARF
jgi:hypothetical protein